MFNELCTLESCQTLRVWQVVNSLVYAYQTTCVDAYWCALDEEIKHVLIT